MRHILVTNAKGGCGKRPVASNLAAYYAEAGLITLSLNVIMLALAWLIARFFGSGLEQRIAISIECGLQNGTLAIAVATLLFGGGAVVIPAGTYSLTMFVTALIFIYFLRRQATSIREN